LRRIGSESASVAAGAFAASAAFFVHALVDWLWAFPALGVLAFGMLGVATRIDDRADDEPPRRAATMPFLGRLALAVLVLASAVSLAIPGIAARYTMSAYDDFRSDPSAALERLERAADLNPLSDEPLVAQGVIEQRLGRPRRALAPLRGAIERRPGNWFSHLELGLAESAVGHPRLAMASLKEAARLNPRQPLVHDTLEKLRRGRRVDPVAVERELYRSLQDRLQATDPDAASHSENDAR
jgi:tetratricopeptide (TPR) repeat protein